MFRKGRLLALLLNWISLSGILLGALAFMVATILMIVDAREPFSSPYLGIITYLIAPGILFCGLFLIAIGMIWNARRIKRRGFAVPLPVIDLNHPKTVVGVFLVGFLLFLFLVLSGIGSYRAYHFTESVEFCGETCHQVMKPEFTAYRNSPHANVSCTECHIGSGAEWFVKSKLSGLYQVYSTAFDKYHRPIEAPVENLRPAKETCYTCHWPKKFFGAVQRTWTYFLPDEENSPWTIRMMMKIGGGDPAHGLVEGIHWHMSEDNVVDYVASDKKRLVIPWVRVTDQEGNVTIYRTENEDEALSEEQIAAMSPRRMDCIDCHNRPTHQFHSPNKTMDLALFLGKIDRSMPEIKDIGTWLLSSEYETEQEALETIEEELRSEYSEHPGLDQAIRSVIEIYTNNFFPEMKASWKEYPDHIGHKITPGCFRCHDGKHVSDTGKRLTKDCNICHTIVAQGPGTEITAVTSNTLEFDHPGDDKKKWKTERCDTCHTGTP